MSRTIEFVFYCINNATVLQHGLSYILTPASKYREVYVLCFFFCMCTSTFFTTLLPHPAWHGFHSAPGCRLCTPKLFSFCPTSGTEPVLPFHLPRCADAPRCISAVHWSSLASPLRKTQWIVFRFFLFVTPSPKVYKIKQYFCYRNNSMPRVTVMHNCDCDGNPTVLL